MVAAIRSWRLRSRFFLAWLVTRQQKFRPIYPASVIPGDLIGQAVNLSDCGYHVAAAMLARAALETRTKRLAMISPDWQSIRKGRYERLLIHLHAVGVISTHQKGHADQIYSKLSNIVHCQSHDTSHASKLVRSTRSLIRELNSASARVLKHGVLA